MVASAKIGWSVMGTGTIATEHMVAAIRAFGHEPLWVVSRNREYAKFFSEDLDIPNTSTEANRAVGDPSVNFIYVSAKRDRRKHYIAAAAEARKNVLCDGPIAGNTKIASGLIERCKRSGVVLIVNQPSRASAIHQLMQRLVSEGEIGSVKSVHIIRGGPYHPVPTRRSEYAPVEGDASLDTCVEDIDLGRFLTGADPLEVSALATRHGESPEEQLAYAVYMSNDIVLQVYESFTIADVESLVMVAGDEGVLIANGTLNGRGTGTLIRRIDGRNELIPVRERDPYLTVIEGFTASSHRQHAWLADGQDNLIALRTAEAVAQAVKKRRSVVLELSAPQPSKIDKGVSA